MTEETSENQERVPFWKARSSLGRRPIFDDSEQMWSACVEYFDWVDANPLMSVELVKFQGAANKAEVPKMRAMTLGGLHIFLDITRQTWTEYKENKGVEFFAVVNAVEDIIRTQKFEGAAADLLNANIIARDLGLSEKNEHTGRDGGPIETKQGFDLSNLDATDREALRGILTRRAGKSGGGAE